MSVFDVFFGCWHRRYSFPITVRGGLQRPAAAAVTGTYVVCLDCGREFPYDWNTMKKVKVVAKHQGASSGSLSILSDAEAI
jgi:hypothetical protein